MAIAGLGTILAGWVLMFVLPGGALFGWIIVGVGTAVIVVSVILDLRRVRSAISSRRGRFGVDIGVSIALFFGIVLFLNAINITWSARVDLTGADRFTLTSQTRDALSRIERPITIVTLFGARVDPTVVEYTEDLLAEYQEHTDRIETTQVDPDVAPEEARRYGLDQRGAQEGLIVVQSDLGERRIQGSRMVSEPEYALTSAIVEVTGENQRKIYLLTGHGEIGGEPGFEAAVSGLRDNLFGVRLLDITRAGGIPADASALLVAGPRAELPAPELDVLRRYMQMGGRMMLLLDPEPPESFRTLVAEFGVTIEDGIVIDPDSFVAPRQTNLLIPASRNGFQIADTYLLGATAIVPSEAMAGMIVTPVAWTSNDAWVDRSPAADSEPRFDPDEDRRGPFALAVLAAASGSGTGGTRMVVVGDSDFATNLHIQSGGNGAMFLTMVNWLVAGEEVISIDRKVLSTRRFILTRGQRRFVAVSSVGLLPLGLIVLAGVVFWRRRR